MYGLDTGAPKKKILTVLDGEVNSNTVIIRNYSTLLTTVDRSSRDSIRK